VKEKSYTRWVLWVNLGGNDMETGVMEDDTPIGQVKEWKMAWKQVSLMVNGCQMLEYLQKIVVPSQDKRKYKYISPIFQWKSN
jgi:hypothetical protein